MQATPQTLVGNVVVLHVRGKVVVTAFVVPSWLFSLEAGFLVQNSLDDHHTLVNRAQAPTLAILRVARFS